jgi:hypothetical protein
MNYEAVRRVRCATQRALAAIVRVLCAILCVLCAILRPVRDPVRHIGVWGRGCGAFLMGKERQRANVAERV